MDVYGKSLAERPKKSPFLRPICDGKNDVRKRAAKVVCQSIPKINSSPVRVIMEGATTPRAQHQRVVSVGPCDGEHAVNSFLQKISGSRLANNGSIRGSTRNDAQQPKFLYRRSVIRSKDRNVGRIDRPIRRIRLWTLSVLLVHRVVDQCLVKSAGSTKHFLLRSGTAKEAPSGMNTVGEIQGKRPQTSLYEA